MFKQWRFKTNFEWFYRNSPGTVTADVYSQLGPKINLTLILANSNPGEF